jgi:predicted ATPase/DNA-binding SARP family transcriptional activator/DNA-binding CsgD family transcriptional regulator
MCPLTRSEYEAFRSQGPEAVRVWLLGGFEVSIGHRTIGGDAWRLRKASALVKLLALAPGHRLHREQIMDHLWPDSGRRAASNNLRKTLHAARRTLDPAAGYLHLLSQDQSLVLGPRGDLWVDVDAFEEAAATARRSNDPAASRAALDLYGGELLPGDRYEGWAEEPRHRLREMYLSLLLRLARLYEEHGDYEPAVEALRGVVAEEPTHEEAHVGLMRLYALSGSTGEALAQYGRLEEVLLRELGTEPTASSRALREEIAAGRFSPKEAPSITHSPEEALGAPKHNLPAARTSFVGREREMVQIKRELAMTRLLTLKGAGGSGKTRVALEVARDLVPSYPDGVWLVELAPLSEGELVSQAVSQVLSVREQPGRSLTDTLAEVLRQREMLLLLDNCEHLADSVARLLDALLDLCPRLRVLATSRETLGVEGEVIWRVSSLPVPDTDRLPAAKEMTRYDAVRLFLDRARLRLPDFDLAPDNAEAVAEVCRKLEGMPLAIELATARVGALSVGQICERLRDPLGLLSAGGRTAGLRHQTLRGTLDWSYELLSESERGLFARLSVFAGGWTLEAAEVLGAGDGVEEDDVLDLLSKLVDKSLVVTTLGAEGTPRYRMLELVRQYALEKLEESGEAEANRRRHAEFFLALAEEAEPGLWGPDQMVWFERLKVEHDNMRAALSRSIERGEDELGVRLAGALRWFWHGQGYYGEGRRWLEEALSRDSRASVASRAKALSAVGWLAMDQDDTDRVVEAAQEGLELSAGTEIEDLFGASFMRMLGSVARMRGDYEQASQLYAESLARSRSAEDRRGIAYSLLNLAIVSRDQGDYERATFFYEEGVALCRESGYAALLAEYLVSMGYEFLLRGDYERATALNEEAAVLLRERGHAGGLEFALDNLGWAALLRQNYERAMEMFKESLVLCLKLGDKLVAVESLEGMACTAGARAEDERAARLFGAARGLREALGYEQEPRARALREPHLAAARSRMNEAFWEATSAEGQSMGLEEAVAYALSDVEPTTLTPQAPDQPVAHPSSLTHREGEIAALVTRGLTNRQIASELSISEHTAATHVRRTFKKLGLHSRAELASWVSDQQSSSRT